MFNIYGVETQLLENISDLVAISVHRNMPGNCLYKFIRLGVKGEMVEFGVVKVRQQGFVVCHTLCNYADPGLPSSGAKLNLAWGKLCLFLEGDKLRRRSQNDREWPFKFSGVAFRALGLLPVHVDCPQREK